MSKEKYDFVIIGSGPGGIYAGVQAAKLGRSVAIIEKNPDQLGGAWIHTGTIPSKTLRESLDIISRLKFHVGPRWVERILESLSAEKLMGRASDVSQQEENHVKSYLEKNGIDIIRGTGQLEDRSSVRVNIQDGSSTLVHAEKILIATGSRPRRPDDIPFDGWRVVDSDEILRLDHVPKKMIIYGAGVIGCEYACIFNGLGVEVTIVDARDRIMQYIDREISEELKRIMENSGIEFVMNSKINKVSVSGADVNADFGEHRLNTELLFFAAGRVSNTDKIGLERVGVKLAGRGAIQVNEFFQTNYSNIYAVGDAIGSPALASTSSEQGRFASCHAWGELNREFPQFFPIGIYTIPEVSSIGPNEKELKDEGIPYVVGRASFREVSRGYISGETQGLLKILVCEKTQKLLGVHIVGQDACNLIHVGLSFMLMGGHVQDFVDKMIFNYPTLSETYRIAAFNALNKIFPDGKFVRPPVKVAA